MESFFMAAGSVDRNSKVDGLDCGFQRNLNEEERREGKSVVVRKTKLFWKNNQKKRPETYQSWNLRQGHQKMGHVHQNLVITTISSNL
ncbi:unnamed protein product [Prunus armeniaca]